MILFKVEEVRYTPSEMVVSIEYAPPFSAWRASRSLERLNSVPLHSCRLYNKPSQALHRLLNLLASVLPLVAYLAAQFLKIPSGRSTANPSLVRVTAVRGRVFAHGVVNYDNFVFCQWCAARQREDRAPDVCSPHRQGSFVHTVTAVQYIKNSSNSAVRRDATALAFGLFLVSRK